MQWGTPMFGNVTALVGWIYVGGLKRQKHAAHTFQACGLGSSQVMSPDLGSSQRVCCLMNKRRCPRWGHESCGPDTQVGLHAHAV